MGDEFVKTLNGNIITGQAVGSLPFHRKWLELQQMMFEENSHADRGHPYESRPWQWPFHSGGVAFWCSDENRQQIYFIGNLPGWWIATGSLILFVIVIVVYRLCCARGISLLQNGMCTHELSRRN